MFCAFCRHRIGTITRMDRNVDVDPIGEDPSRSRSGISIGSRVPTDGGFGISRRIATASFKL